MCDGEGCEKKDSCYRQLAKPDLIQTYFTSNWCIENGHDHYLELELKSKTYPRALRDYWKKQDKACMEGDGVV